MDTNFEDLKRLFVEKKVADSNIYLENILINLYTLKYSNNLVLDLIEEFRNQNREMYEKIGESLSKTGNAKIQPPKLQVKILNKDIDISFLINKSLKDIIQYSNNILDSLAQLVNCALIYPSYSINNVDFGYLYKKDKNGNSVSKLAINTCTNVEKKFDEICNSNTFNYLRKANNRIKHITDIKIDLSLSLLEKSTIENINSFTKKDEHFDEAKLIDKCQEIYKFIEECVDKVCMAISVDLQTVSIKYRYNCIDIMGQGKDVYDFDNLDFLIAYVKIQLKDNETLPNQIELIRAAIKPDNELELLRYDYDYILLEINGQFKGYATLNSKSNSDDILTYAKYDVIEDDGAKFNELLINHTKMRFYPLASNSKIVQRKS